GERVWPVNLVEIDVVGPEAAQRVLTSAKDPASCRAPVVEHLIAHRMMQFGGHDYIVAAPPQSFADDLLRLPIAVHVGGVDEVDPAVEAGVNDPDGVIMIRVALASEHHGPKAQPAYDDTAAAE